jgi:hypothetical protein
MSIAGFPGILLIIGLVIGSVAIFGNMLALVMVGKVNERLPEPERISYLWWTRYVLKKYEQLYPDGKLGYLWRACEIAMALGFASGVVYVFLMR